MAREPEKRDKPDKPHRKVFGPNDSGQEAFDHMFARLRTGMFSLETYNGCHGVRLWRKFLQRKPDATLAECLEEYERQMPRYNDAHWTYRLIEAFRGQVYPEFTRRVLALAPPQVAHDLKMDRAAHRFDDDEIAILDRCATKAKVKQGKCAPRHVKGPVITARAKK